VAQKPLSAKERYRCPQKNGNEKTVVCADKTFFSLPFFWAQAVNVQVSIKPEIVCYHSPDENRADFFYIVCLVPIRPYADGCAGFSSLLEQKFLCVHSKRLDTLGVFLRSSWHAAVACFCASSLALSTTLLFFNPPPERFSRMGACTLGSTQHSSTPHSTELPSPGHEPPRGRQSNPHSPSQLNCDAKPEAKMAARRQVWWGATQSLLTAPCLRRRPNPARLHVAIVVPLEASKTLLTGRFPRIIPRDALAWKVRIYGVGDC